MDDGQPISNSLPGSRFLAEAALKRLHYYPRALQAVLHAHAALPETVRLEDVAAHVGMAPASFSRFFTEKIGLPFTAVMKALRIELAVTQMESRFCSVEVLANASGYVSSCAFTRAFKEVVGVTPSDYRRRHLA